MNVKSIVKKIVPDKCWFFIRKCLITLKHCLIVAYLSPIVKRCDKHKLEKPNCKAKVSFPDNKRIIWQYWAQGYDNNLPEIVKICLKSVDIYASEYIIIRLSDANIKDYIDVPSYISRDAMSAAHYSDVLRLLLLSTYGGLWLDTAMLLTGKLPEYILNEDFFMYQRDKNEPHKDYWENSFAYYFGWNIGFRVNVLNGIIYSKPNGKVVTDLCSMMLFYWKHHKRAVDYFFFQIMTDLYLKKNPDINCTVVNDCIPHLLRQKINADYPYLTVDEILRKTTLHSLSRKAPGCLERLKDILVSSKLDLLLD